MAEASEDDVTVCQVCNDKLRQPKLLPCLHVFCNSCLTLKRRGTKSSACPLCSFDVTRLDPSALTEKGCQFIQNYMKMCQESPEVPDDDDKGDNSGTDIESEGSDIRNSDSDEECRLESVLSRRDEQGIYCSSHPQEQAEDFCVSCQRIICDKCLTGLHRRCKETVSLQEAVDMNMVLFNTAHDSLTKVFLGVESKLEKEQTKTEDLLQQKEDAVAAVKQMRDNLIEVVLEKERELLKDIDEHYTKMNRALQENILQGGNLKAYVQKSVDVFECAMSMNGQGELLELEQGITESSKQYKEEYDKFGTNDPPKKLSFVRNEDALSKLEQTLHLGEVILSDERSEPVNGVKAPIDSPWEGNLTLITCFHGGTRDDIAEPLLTDVLVLPGGDVILTDRDNKCLKKFNCYGKVLTRVPIPDTPSRIATISHSKIVVAVMNKKLLLFFSVFGTLRILAQVRTKKQYPYITSTQDGDLLAGTSHCDTIDLISQTGVFIRTIYAHKSEKVLISRPLYLAQSPKGNFLVSDSGRRNLFALDKDGNKVSSYKSKETEKLECPLGVGCDIANHAILADRDGNSLHLVSPKGVLVKKILTEEDSLNRPCGVCVTDKNILALTQVDGYVKVYKAG